jgi:hypothetical protein
MEERMRPCSQAASAPLPSFTSRAAIRWICFATSPHPLRGSLRAAIELEWINPVKY